MTADVSSDRDAYNYRHSRLRHLVFNLRQTLGDGGARPGAVAPDFTLPCVGGGRYHLHDEDRRLPVMLRFASFT